MARNAAKQALISALGVALLLTVASTPLNARRHPTHAAPTSNAASTKPSVAPQTVATERLLAQVFEALDQHKMDLALQRVDALIAARPNYRLAHLIRGDLLLARTRPISGFASGVRAPGDKVEDLRAEALARLRAMRERPKAEQVPRYLLQLRPNQKHALVVDTKRSRLYVYENQRGRLQFVTDYYVTIGKQGAAKMREGDQKTPLGVYHVTANLPRAKLTDFYGSGAFPINYPNEWDKRQGRNGHGIWLHGTPSDTYARPPRASDGCIVLSNPDLEALGLGLQVGLTTVIIAEELSPATIDALGPDFEIVTCDGADRSALLAAIVDVDAVLVRSATQIDAEALGGDLVILRADGSPLRWGRAVIRALFCAAAPWVLGFVALSRKNRGIHDVVLGTRVTYDWARGHV